MSCSCCSAETKACRFEPFIDPFTLWTRCRLENGPRRFKKPALGPQSDDWKSSRLQFLPIELYQTCLSYLDLATLTAMRRVSQYTRHAIDSLYQYQELYERAPQALRACLSTGVAPHIPLRRLHCALTSMECYYCKISDDPQFTFGSYLSLYEGQRCCLFCLRNNPQLKPVELMTLITLRCQKNSSLRSTTSFPIITTIPGPYFPLPNRPLRYPRMSLLRAYSITSNPEQTLNEKERLALFGNSRTAATNHHPFIAPSEESDISPVTNYVAPETMKQIAQLYMSAVSFPYLPSTKNITDYGVLCADCCLHMRYEEHRWREEQRNRRMNGQDPTASLRTRERINGLRKKACRMYTATEEAHTDDINRKNDGWKVVGQEMTIQEHRLVHVKEKMSKSEVEWRASKNKQGPPLPLLRHDNFG